MGSSVKFHLALLGVLLMLWMLWAYSTGSLFPLVHIDWLESPIPVHVDENGQLRDLNGGIIRVPYVERIVTNDVVNLALERGVEVTREGDVYVLLKIWHCSGLDPYLYDRRRIGLSAIVLLTNPNSLDALPSKGPVELLDLELYKGRNWCWLDKDGAWPFAYYLMACQLNKELSSLSGKDNKPGIVK